MILLLLCISSTNEVQTVSAWIRSLQRKCVCTKAYVGSLGPDSEKHIGLGQHISTHFSLLKSGT